MSTFTNKRLRVDYTEVIQMRREHNKKALENHRVVINRVNPRKVKARRTLEDIQLAKELGIPITDLE